MPNNTQAWIDRAEKLLGGAGSQAEVIQFGTSLVSAVYGPQSPQITAYNTALAQIAKSSSGVVPMIHNQHAHADGVIRNVVAEIKAGLITSLRAQVAGEIFVELMGLAKEALGEQSDAAKNVAAVLIASGFEDLMRRMGSELAAVRGRPKLEEVITALKDAAILKGGEVGTALSYLKFRNDSLHADWANVQRSQVESCMAFVEALLVKHFS